jgi:hypothetical protein
MDYTEIYPPRLVLCRDWKELQRCETTSRSMYGTSRQKSLCLRPMISASVSRHKKKGRNARNEIHTRRPVRCIVIICTKGKVACKCNEKSEDSLSQKMDRPLTAKGETDKRKNHPIPLPTCFASFSGLLLSPPLGASERKLHPAGAFHSTIA